MISLKSGLSDRIEDWQARGLIDANTARLLRADVAGQGSGTSFASVAVWLGVVCLAFGAMTFVAANWDAMPRLLRMAALLGGVLLSYVLSGVLMARNHPALAQAFVLLGCGVFGAAVMLTGQMYHIPGPPSGGVLLWGAGSFAAALLLRSEAALGLAVILATVWACMEMALDQAAFYLWFLPIWGAMSLCAWWCASRPVAHLCALALLVWLVMSVVIHVEVHDAFTVGYLCLMGALASISVLVWSARGPMALRGFERDGVFYLVALIFLMLALLAAWWGKGEAASLPLSLLAAIPLIGIALAPLRGDGSRFDHSMCAIWIAVSVPLAFLVRADIPYVIEGYALMISVWAIRMGGRQAWPPVTALGYAAFAVTMLVIYAEAANGLLGTSLFYLIAGALLLVGALIVPRILGHRAEGGA